MEMRNQSKLRGALTKVLILSIFVVALMTLPHASPVQAQTDDYSDKKSEATLLRTDGSPRLGAINAAADYNDVDYFKFETQRGVRYTFELEFVDRDQDTLQDAKLKVINSDARGPMPSEGQVESRTEEMKTVKWVARTADTYFFTVSTAYASGVSNPYLGQYRLRVHAEANLEDFHLDARDQSERITFGSKYQGAISPWSNQPGFSGTVHGGDDYDFFNFDAVRGVKYSFTATLDGMDGLSMEVTDAGGKSLAHNKRQGNTLEWVASTEGLYYVTLTGSPLARQPVGAYTLQVDQDTTLRDRYPESQGSAQPVTLGNFIQGAVSPREDKDYFSLSVQRGVKYAIDMDLAQDGAVHIEVRDRSDRIEATNRGMGSKLEWTVSSEGEMYIVISASLRLKDPVVAYNFRITGDNAMQDRHADTESNATRINLGIGVAASISPPGEKDYFEFVAQRGVKYIVNASPGSMRGMNVQIYQPDEGIVASADDVGSGLEWIAPADGTYYVIVSGRSADDNAVGTYNIQVDDDNSLLDRHADNRNNATPINLGIGMAASISPPGDKDYFEFTAQRGVSYTLQVSLGTAPGLRVQIASSDQDIEISADSIAEDLTWTAPEDGAYYLIVSGLSQRDDSVGAYNIRIDGDHSLQDRHGDDRSGATIVGYGNLVSGAISPEEDQDYFSFHATRGVQYTFILAYDGTDAVSLAVEGEGDHSGVLATNFGQGSELVWVAPDNGEYYLVVSKSPMVIEGAGAYTLEIAADTSLEDRHPEDYRFATKIGAGSAISAAISPADDQDYFLFAAEKDATYSLIVELGTAESVIMTISHFDSGFTKTNYGSGDSLQWTAPTKGDYIVLVTGAALVEEPVGTYRITMRRGELPELPAVQPETQPVTPVGSTETPVQTPETQTQPEPPAVPSGAVLRVGSRMAAPGATVLVPIRLEQAEQVGSLGFNLNYNPAVARAVRVYRGARMSPATFSFNAATPGLIRIGAAAHDAVSGDGSAAVIEFRIVGERGSYSDITLTDMEVSDFSGARRSIGVHHGSLTVDAAGVGDGNGDGRITAVDALIAMRMFTGLVNEDLVMDVNGDGRVTPVDSMQVLNLARRG